MELSKSQQEFSDAVIAAANYYHLSPAIVENGMTNVPQPDMLPF